MENMENSNLERTNTLQIEISIEEGIDLIDFIDKYAIKVRDLLELGITDKNTIKKHLKI